MILELTNLEVGSKQSRNGKDLTGLFVTGIKFDQEGEPGEQWDKFLMDWKNPEEIEVLINAGVGAKVNLKMERDPANSRFWNCTGATIVSSGEGSASVGRKAAETKPTETQKGVPSKNSTATEAAVTAITAYPAMQLPDVKQVSLEASLKFTRLLVTANEGFKKILPVTKTTMETLMQLTLENASKFESYLAGDVEADVASDDSDLEKNGAEPDDDIPF